MMTIFKIVRRWKKRKLLYKSKSSVRVTQMEGQKAGSNLCIQRRLYLCYSFGVVRLYHRTTKVRVKQNFRGFERKENLRLVLRGSFEDTGGPCPQMSHPPVTASLCRPCLTSQSGILDEVDPTALNVKHAATTEQLLFCAPSKLLLISEASPLPRSII